MTGTNNFIQLASSGGANVVSQADYVANTGLINNGFSSGIAESNQVNKTLRQTSAIAQCIGQFIAAAGQNAIDDGNASNLLAAFTAAVAAASNAALQVAYPVGGLYISASSTNPNTILGFGSWSQYASGRVLVGAGTYNDGATTYTFVAGTTYGEFNHTLSVGEMPSHNHTVNDPTHAHGVAVSNGGGGSTFTQYIGGGGFQQNNATTSSSTGVSINNTGGNGGHNNIQPSLGVYIWLRTA